MPTRRVAADAPRPLPSAAAGPASSSARPRMYNLGSHALSSGSLLPRTSDMVSLPIAAASVVGGGAVAAADAPYLTNVENHWGRVTLTAPDNMRRRQAKEKKQKARQKKAQTAQMAASALAGISQTVVPSQSSRPGSASISNASDTERRYTIAPEESTPSSAGMLLAPSQPAIRRAHSGTQTVTLAAVSHPPVSAPEPTRRVRRRRASNPRDDGDRPTSTSNVAAPPPPSSSRSQFDTDPTPSAAVPSAAAQPSSMHRQNIWNDITEPDPDDLPPPFPQGAPRPPTPPPPHSSSANDQQLFDPQPHYRIPDSPPPAFRSDPESEADDIEPLVSTTSPHRSRRRSSASSRRRTSLPSPRSIHSSTPSEEVSSDDAESVEIAQERQAWEADIRNGLSFDQRLLREQQRRVARERALLHHQAQAQPEPATDDQVVVAVVESHSPVLDTTPHGPASTETAQIEENGITVVDIPQVPSTPLSATEVDARVQIPIAEREPSPVVLTGVESAPIESEVPVSVSVTVSQPAVVLAVSNAPPVSAPLAAVAPTVAAQIPSAAHTSAPARQKLHNETRLGLPPLPQPRAPALTAQPAQPKRIVHQKTQSDSRTSGVTTNATRSTIHTAGRPTSTAPRLRIRSANGVVRPANRSEPHLALNRRPEDTLFVISAPPAVASVRPESDDNVSSRIAPVVEPVTTHAPVTPVSDSGPSQEDDEGAESDSSIEQWLAESAAFDALRRKEEEAAARLRAIQEAQVSDTDDESDQGDEMPGAFNPRRQAEQAALRRKWPDPANLALLDKARIKAPPPLVLGRSRGGAAYSDSSSDSTDTDDALDQYSLSEDEDQFQDDPRAIVQSEKTSQVPTTSTTLPFVNSRSSTLSEPDLTGVYKQPPLPPRPQVAVADQTKTSVAPVRSSSTSFREGTSAAKGVTRSLSSTARGKQPERPTVQQPEVNPKAAVAPTPNARAGDFEEDESSSRDVSDVEEVTETTASAQHRTSVDARRVQATGSRATPSILDTSRSSSSDFKRVALEPLFQPLPSHSRPKSDLGGRLKGLFGQPLISSSEPVAPETQVEAKSPTIVEAVHSSEQEDGLAPRQDHNDQASIRSATTLASTKSQSATLPNRPTPEQKARNEALSQIAKLSSASSSQRDSLAALERLLAKTSRHSVSTVPSSASGYRNSVQGPRPLAAEVAIPEQVMGDEQAVADRSLPVPSTQVSRLSRQGAITRGRTSNEASTGLLAPPVMYQTTGSTRPVSFVNPRSSAAPLPRGRLPAITDATRHFPPSAQNPASTSWIASPDEEEESRLPAPLEPRRLSMAHSARADPTSPVRNPSSKVSQMISRFETPPAGPPAVPIRKQVSSASLVDTARTDQEAPVLSEAVIGGTSNSERPAEPLRRRPPPPPPPPRSPVPQPASESSPFRSVNRNSIVPPLGSPPQRSVNVAEVQRITAMDALARHIDEAAVSWSSPQRASFASPLLDRDAVAAVVPASEPVPRSPRTLAMENLTRRESLNGATTPPRIPSKSPLLTPEQIFAGGSRTGLSASIAAAQAASLARRASRAARSGSTSSGNVNALTTDMLQPAPSPTRNQSSHSGVAGLFGPVVATEPTQLSYGLESSTSTRPLPAHPDSRQPAMQGRGLMDSAVLASSSSSQRLPAPPPLPSRPRDRKWDSYAQAHLHPSPSDSRATARSLPSVPDPVPSRSQPEQSETTLSPTRDAPSSNTPTLSTLVVEEGANDAGGSSAGESQEASPLPLAGEEERGPRREASLGITDFDLLVAQLERDGTHFEQLSAIGEFLGPARATSATREQMASLSVGKVECDARRVTREGKVKQKLSCVGVRVDKCTICQSQFKQHQLAAILPCLHIFHEECATRLFQRVNTCPTCRRLAFDI